MYLRRAYYISEVFVGLIYVFGHPWLCLVSAEEVFQNTQIISHDTSSTTVVGIPVILNTEDELKNISTLIRPLTTKMTKRKTKRRRKRKFTSTTEMSVSTTHSLVKIKTNTKPKRRKTKKFKKRKQSKNILEITTAKVVESNGNELNTTTILDTNPVPISNLNQSINSNLNGSSGSLKTIKKRIFRDRCKKNNGGCSQICRRKTKRKCSCVKGYKLAMNKKKCIDINECAMNNGGCQNKCQNTRGSFHCQCPSGFTLAENLKSCQDINECLLRNGHGLCQGTCKNTHGSYTCDCSSLIGTHLAADNHACQDIDECAEDVASTGCSHECINTLRGYSCSCPDGMALMSDLKTCQDINECEDETIEKSCKHGCVNTIGSYQCVNDTDYQSDQLTEENKTTFCPKLSPPLAKGFVQCSREKWFNGKNFGRKRIYNGPGTRCKLSCPDGFLLSGSYEVRCTVSGEWLGNQTGQCIEASKSPLRCPRNQEKFLSYGKTLIDVNFDSPETSLDWKYVKSNPEWAVNLNGILGKGFHVIMFFVTDPVTKLTSTCSFTIVIKTPSS